MLRHVLSNLDEAQLDALLDMLVARAHPDIAAVTAAVVPSARDDSDNAHAQTERRHRRESFSHEAAHVAGAAAGARVTVAHG